MLKEINRAIGRLTPFQTLVIMVLVNVYMAIVVFAGYDFEGLCRFLRRW